MSKNQFSKEESIQITYELIKNPQYSGIPSSQKTFLSFKNDPLYLFPILDTQDVFSEAKATISYKILTYARTANISQALSLLHSSSPFRRTLKSPESVIFNFSNEAPANSFMTGQDLQTLEHPPEVQKSKEQTFKDFFLKDLQVFEVHQVDEDLNRDASSSNLSIQQVSRRSLTPSLEQQCPIIDSSAIREIKGLHLKFMVNADEGVFRSITPVNSFESETMAEQHLRSKHLHENSLSRLSQFSVVANDLSENWGSIIQGRPSDADEMFIRSIVGRMEENNDECMSLVDEGVVQHVRDFIPVESTASKNLLVRSNRLEFDLPSALSPILPKMVVCQEVENDETGLQIIASCSFTGFRTGLSIEYSNIEATTKSKVDKDRDLFTCKSLFTEKVLLFISQNQVVFISCGFEHSALLTSSGKVLTWGYGASGCLGHGSTASLSFPTEVAGLPVITYMECGGHHNLAISLNHEAFMWGRGEVHQLGINNRQLCKDEMGYVALKPIQLSYFSNRNIQVKAGACGESHTLLLDTQGKVFAFGWGELGQLGIERKFLTNQMRTNEITAVNLISSKVKKVAAGLTFSAALCENGDVVVWGLGTHGQLGLGPGIKKLEHPCKVNLNGEAALDLACGENNVLVLTLSGKCFAWGLGKTGVFSHQENVVPVGTEMICPFPRVLGETDIVHHFVVGLDNRKVFNSLEYREILGAIGSRNR